MSKIRWKAAAGIAALVGIAGCGDNVATEAPPPVVTPGVVVRVDAATAAECAFGGSVIKSGRDLNLDHALEDDEITTSTPVCNDPPATPVPSTVTRLVAEPIGAHCAIAGTAVLSGPDTNGNGVLDDDEIATTVYLCGEPLLTRVVERAPDATCLAGGVAFQVGRDRNADHVLGDDEVEQTEVSCGTELAGDVAIGSADDAAALAAITLIGGSLTLDASGASTLALPALAVVRGGLAIRNAPALTSVALPALASVGGVLAVTDNARLATLEAPKLAHAGGLVIDHDPALSDLSGVAALTQVIGDVQITHNAALTALPELHGGPGKLTIDDNAQLGQLVMHIDDQLGALHVGGNPALSSIAIAQSFSDFVALGSIAIDGNPQLSQISINAGRAASIAIDDNPVLANVTIATGDIVGDLAVRGNGPTSLSLPNGQTTEFPIGGALALTGPITALHSREQIKVAGECTIDGTRLTALGELDSVLDCAGPLHITHNPQLAHVGVVRATSSLEVRGNPLLGDLGFFVGVVFGNQLLGDVTIVDNASLRSSTGLVGLGHVGGNVTITGNPLLETTFSSDLTSINGAVVFAGNDQLRDLGLGHVHRVGSLAVTSCGALTALDLPLLSDVGSQIAIRNNATLTVLRLPALAGADMAVTDNPHLPACAVAALFAGLTGEHTQSGNDDTAVCAP